MQKKRLAAVKKDKKGAKDADPYPLGSAKIGGVALIGSHGITIKLRIKRPKTSIVLVGWS